MFKFKTALIAAAALLSVSAPTLAYAGKVGEAFKELRAQRDEIRLQKLQNRVDFLNGTITRAEYRQLRQDYVGQIEEVKDTLDEYRATR